MEKQLHKILINISREGDVSDKDVKELNNYINLVKKHSQKGMIKIEDVKKMIEKCDCDCKEFGNLKICGRCQVLIKLEEKENNEKTNW